MTPSAQRDREQGSATIWMVSVVSATFLLVGLVLDGGAMLRARSDAFAAAGAAARAGAQELDRNAAVEGDVVLDPATARTAALDQLRQMGFDGTATTRGSTVTVTAYTHARLQVLTLVGGGSTVSFAATAAAQATKVDGP